MGEFERCLDHEHPGVAVAAAQTVFLNGGQSPLVLQIAAVERLASITRGETRSARRSGCLALNFVDKELGRIAWKRVQKLIDTVVNGEPALSWADAALLVVVSRRTNELSEIRDPIRKPLLVEQVAAVWRARLIGDREDLEACLTPPSRFATSRARRVAVSVLSD